MISARGRWKAGEKMEPVDVECELHVAGVRLGHDARDLVELLALSEREGQVQALSTSQTSGKELGGAHAFVYPRDIEHVFVSAGARYRCNKLECAGGDGALESARHRSAGGQEVKRKKKGSQ